MFITRTLYKSLSEWLMVLAALLILAALATLIPYLPHLLPILHLTS